MNEFFVNLLDLSLEAAPWLVLGLVVGGLIKALVPTSFLQKHLSGNGLFSIIKAALFGAPLPLCSCGVIPAALGLRRAGASKPATVSFLVSTPETGIDSVTISYALLGPFMAIVRPIAAIVSAIVSGLLVGRSEDDRPIVSHSNHSHSEHSHQQSAHQGHDHSEQVKDDSCHAAHDHPHHEHKMEAKEVGENSCCSSDITQEPASCCSAEKQETSSCCGTSHDTDAPKQGFLKDAWAGIVYSFDSLFVDVLFWLIIGLVFAALVKTFVPVTFLAEWGSGLPAMLLMLGIGIPMYVCATASTPIAAGLLLAGVSPGTAMVFLMAGPATNISTLGIIGKELGRRSLLAYLTGVGVVTLITGYIVDYLVGAWNIDVQAQIAHSQDIVPPVIAWASLLLLIAVAIKLKAGSYFKPKDSCAV